jgi:hypothetical protein
MSLILALIMASEPSSECPDHPCVEVEVAAPFLLGTGPSLPFFSLAVHRTGSVAVDWLDGITVIHRTDSAKPTRRLSLPGQLMYGLEDGRLLVFLPGPGERYEVWSWDGNSRVDKLAEANSAEALAAAVCHVPVPSPVALKGVMNVACVGRSLVANDEVLNVVVWRGARWISTGARVGLWGVINCAQLTLTGEEYASAHDALARFSIPAVREPKDSTSVSCGSHACWALNRTREVLLLDLDSPVREWRKIGAIAGRSYPAFKIQGANERAVFTTEESCCRRFYYLGLPAGPRAAGRDAGTR